MIRRKCWRHRKTGPDFPLAVVHCRTHDISFTLYPPGFVPYSRVPLVLLGPCGNTVEREKRRPFSGTLFQAVLDGARGVAWPKESYDGNMQPRFTTQKRHIQRCILILGLARGSPISHDMAVQTLRLPGLWIDQARKRVAREKGFQYQSATTVEILVQLDENRTTFTALVTHVNHACLWPGLQARRSPLGNAG